MSRSLTPKERIASAKALVIMADDLRHIGKTESDAFALKLADQLERKATKLLEQGLNEEV